MSVRVCVAPQARLGGSRAWDVVPVCVHTELGGGRLGGNVEDTRHGTASLQIGGPPQGGSAAGSLREGMWGPPEQLPRGQDVRSRCCSRRGHRTWGQAQTHAGLCRGARQECSHDFS